MNQGWIKLWRKVIGSRVFLNEGLLKVWVWCLCKATHQGRWVTLRVGRGCTEIKLEPGQFVFGRNSAAKELRMPASTTRDRMLKLQKLGSIRLETDTHFTVVSICNWALYQSLENEIQHPRRQQTRQPNDSKDDTDKKEKNGKNVENKDLRSNSKASELAQHYLGRILAWKPDFKKPSESQFTKWIKEFDRMIRLDNRATDRIGAVIDFATSDTFWQPNILSASKLRRRFDQLEGQMNRGRGKGTDFRQSLAEWYEGTQE